MRRVLVFLAAMLAPSTASAFERQHHIGLDVVFPAMLSVNEKESLSLGAGFGAHYAYGMTDQFTFMAEGAFSIVSLSEPPADAKVLANRPGTVSNAGVGIAYVLDTLRWVPYIGVLLDGYLLQGGNLPELRVGMGMALAAGLDFMATRHVAVGGGVRQHFIFTHLSDYPSFTQIFGRIEFTWGY